MHFEGDISAMQLAQNLMKLGEGKIPDKPPSDLMKLAVKLCHIITRDWNEKRCFLQQAVICYEEIALLTLRRLMSYIYIYIWSTYS